MKTGIKMEDIVFWLLIIAIIAVALWLLRGSPTEVGALTAITVFVAASEILIWKNLFGMDKRTAVGFERVKLHFDKMDKQLEGINNQLSEIRNLIKK